MGTFFHDKKNKELIIYPSMVKMKNGIKVYFYRKEKHGKNDNDYPVAYADTPKGYSIDFPFDFKILGVEVKRKRWFGLLGYYWEVLEEIE